MYIWELDVKCVHIRHANTEKILLKLCELQNILNSIHASGYCCCLFITISNSLNLDQERQNVVPDLDPNCLTLSVPNRILF